MIQSNITQQTLCIYRCENSNRCLALSNTWMNCKINEASQIASIFILSSSTIFCLVLMYHVTLRKVVISSNPDSFCYSAKVMLHNRSLSCYTCCHSNHTDRIKASESRQKMYFIVHHKEARFCVLLCRSLCHFCKSSFMSLTD